MKRLENSEKFKELKEDDDMKYRHLALDALVKKFLLTKIKENIWRNS